MKSSKEIIKVIKDQTGIKNFRDGMLAAHFLCRPLSRYCSVWFIGHDVKPNQITILMILFGIFGSALFALPNIWTKIAGYILWILWFAMDCSDGQVARYTKTFSKYGTEMDYMAHLIDHSCMNLALWATFIEMNKWNNIVISFIFIVSISVELIIRNDVAFTYYQNKLQGLKKTGGTRKNWMKYLITEIVTYPTMIVCFSWIIVVDYYFNFGFSLYLYCIWLICKILLFLRSIIKDILKYYG